MTRQAQLTPHGMASKLLTEARGVQRDAETKAWDQWERHRGDESPEGAENRDLWLIVIKAIVEGTEEPKVERRDAISAPRRQTLAAGEVP